LAFSVVAGFAFPHFFTPLANSAALRNGIVIAVMVLMGWTLQPRSIAKSLGRPLPSLLAILINMLVVPLLAWPSILFLPQHLAGGLIVAALVPCTLASASVWTRAAGGDDAVAMMTTVVTNLLCFAVAPIGLWLLVGQQVQIDVAAQMRSLLLQVVVPLLIGQSLRQIGLAAFADRHKIAISTTAQVGILAMVLLGSTISANRMGAGPVVASGPIVLMAVTAWVVHTIAIAVGYYAAMALGIERPQQLAVAISGGQKTLMVGLQIALGCGVSVLPMVVYHIGQLFIDTLLIRVWKSHRI
jgi:sodium/bile acid cotransporter 7